MELLLHPFLTSALDISEWSSSTLAIFPPDKAPQSRRLVCTLYRRENFLPQPGIALVPRLTSPTTLFIKKKKIQQDATMYQNLLLHIYMKLNMFRATHRP